MGGSSSVVGTPWTRQTWASQAQSVARVEAVELEVLVLEEAVRVARAAREKATGDG